MITEATKFDPDAADPRIVAVLDARAQSDAAFLAQNADAAARFMGDDLIVNGPHNAVIEKPLILAAFRAGMMRYEKGVEARLDFVGVRDGKVVLMGEEIVRPMSGAANAGKMVRRRFTDVWTERDGAWVMALRQATNFEVT